jgi:phosphoglycolate phosphatase
MPSPPLGHVRAIVFDLDGTLVDSLDDIAGHLNAALGEIGLGPYARDEVRRWVGHGVRDLIAHAVGAPDRVGGVIDRFRALYRAAPYGRTSLYAGLDATLDAITARGRVLGVLSNKPHDLAVAIADALLARWPFGAIAGERPGRPLKPDPDAALCMADELGVPPERCVVVGDSEVDVATARGAGMASVAVTWGLRDADVLVGAAPDYLVSTPAELTALFA